MASIERITEVEYDCIAKRLSKVTIGEPYYMNWVLRDVAKIAQTGTIIGYTADSGLEDGEGNYLTTGYSNTNLGV